MRSSAKRWGEDAGERERKQEKETLPRRSRRLSPRLKRSPAGHRSNSMRICLPSTMTEKEGHETAPQNRRPQKSTP